MPLFSYLARDQRGDVQSGRLEAPNEEEVVAQLQRRGLIVTSVSAQGVATSREGTVAVRRYQGRRMHTGVTTDDQVLLCQQLSTLVDAGIPLLRCLEVVSAQVESRKLMAALEDIRRDVSAGRTFRDALDRHPSIFSSLWLNLVETGEASGHLAQSLHQLARHFEAAQHLQNEAKTALTYPAFLVGTAVFVVVVFVYWLIPKFTSMFASLDIELPLITRVVISISDIARRYVVLLIMALAALGWFAGRYFKTEAGQWTKDRLMLRVPGLRTLMTYVQLAEFAQGLSTLLESGVPLLSTLDILGNSATNKLYGQAIRTVRNAVKEGKTVADPLQGTGLFPPMVVQMVQVGEEVGELSKMATRIARHYEERVEMFIARMTRLFEPIAIIVVAVLVLFIVLAIFMPIFQMAGGGGLLNK